MTDHVMMEMDEHLSREDRLLARISQCAPTARFTSEGRIHPGNCR
jgi:hypothetical protein